MTLSHDLVIDHSNYDRDGTLTSQERFKDRLDAELSALLNAELEKRVASQLGNATTIRVRIKLAEPVLHFDQDTGSPVEVMVGNPTYAVGDKIPKPPVGQGGGGAGAGAGQGESEDEYVFELPKEEVDKRLLAGLGLPNLQHRTIHKRVIEGREIAGRQTDGPPAMLDILSSTRNAMGRRIALRRPKQSEIEELEVQIASCKLEQQTAERDTRLAALMESLAALRVRRGLVSYFDPQDLLYRRTEIVYKPVTHAVIFNIMDRSSSMGQDQKEQAKRFFHYLSLLVRHNYTSVEVVHIAHTDTPMEVTEHEFYFGTKGGGTVVASALELMLKIRKERFPLDKYNVYVCQASDGDTAFSYGKDDAEESARIMVEEILPITQYVAYVECHPKGSFAYDGSGKKKKGDVRTTQLWDVYSPVEEMSSYFAMQRVCELTHIVPAFRKLFTVSSSDRISA